jgi:2-polyprenyl-3-methyl-5-hydroxy-6-metoxy-1,4-benzoquinol methylase
VLDCACGVGLLAVGLAQRGFETHASDASPTMVERTRTLAARHGIDVHARTRAWEELPPRPEFDAVFCVGNSLAHAADRPAALSAMAHVLRPGGLLVLTSRNWERERAAGSRLEIDDRLTERGGRKALISRAWTITQDAIALDVAVSIIDDDGTVKTATERLTVWPFTADELHDDLRRAGLEPEQSTYTPESERYLVTASRP